MGSALHGWVGRYRLCVGPATGKATSGDVPWSATHAGLDTGGAPLGWWGSWYLRLECPGQVPS